MSAADRLSASLDGILDFPWEVLEYLTWLRQQPPSRDAAKAYLFDAPRVRFSVHEADRLLVEGGVTASGGPSGLELSAPRATAPVPVGGLSGADVEAVTGLLRRFDGQAALASVRASLPPEQARVLEPLLGAAFGKLIFAPLALLDAERAISGVEVTRFPGSPYEIDRAYWKNMGAVRAASDGLFAALHDGPRFARELRKLHALALLGEDLQTYYRPASPISSGRAAPGRFMHTATELVATGAETIIIAGPRVSAAPVGGERYHELLYESLEEPEAAEPRSLGCQGLDFGQTVLARSAADEASALWFCPPRPLHRDHLELLRGALAAADGAARTRDRAPCIEALAEFHQSFIRLHPFHCGNQSLAMNLVNRVAVSVLGAGMPHLILDHLALRLSSRAYARVFRRAVEAYVDPQPNRAARYLRLASTRTRTFELLRRLDGAPTLPRARALARADTQAARHLLLCD